MAGTDFGTRQTAKAHQLVPVQWLPAPRRFG
jgi:hypothetical protein